VISIAPTAVETVRTILADDGMDDYLLKLR